MKRWHKLFAVLLVCLLTLGSIGYLGIQHSEKDAYADGTLTPIDLGTGIFGPFGISSSGIVSGNVPFTSAYWSTRPAIWQSGIITDLAIPSVSGGYGAAYGISPSGETVGSVADATNVDAAKWDTSGSLTDLGSSSSTDATCNNAYEANAANSNGDVAGFCVEGGATKAGYWPSGLPNSFTKLPDVSNGQGVSSVSGINLSRHMVGYAEVYDITVGPTSHPAYWHDGTVTDLAPTGSYEDYANAINDNDLIVGSVDSPDSASAVTAHPYVWDKAANTTYDLYTLTGFEGVAKAVNNFGTVVGSINVSNNPANHAFMWQKGSSSIIDLNSLLPANSGWVLESADAINTNGQIVGSGLLNGQSHAYLLNVSTPSSYRLSLAPASQTTTIGGGQGLVTATLLDSASSAPASNVTLSFRVEAGPNAGMSGTCFPSSCTTDANGQVDWGYLGTAIGVDTVQVWMDTNGNGVPDTGEPQTTATVTWIMPSSKWAGYVAQYPQSIRPVSARVTLPDVRCNQAGTASIWVGYDGSVPGSNTVEQEGIYANCPSAGGKVEFSLWWELYYPNPPMGQRNASNPIPVPKTLTLVAGDNVYLLVNRITQKSGVDKIYFSIYVEDSAGRSLMKPWQNTEPEPKGFSAKYDSAECIVEAPQHSSNSPTPIFQPLPDFGTLTFTNCSAIDETASLIRLNMLRDGHLLASTSDIALSANGENSFSVTWVSSS